MTTRVNKEEFVTPPELITLSEIFTLCVARLRFTEFAATHVCTIDTSREINAFPLPYRDFLRNPTINTIAVQNHCLLRFENNTAYLFV